MSACVLVGSELLLTGSWRWPTTIIWCFLRSLLSLFTFLALVFISLFFFLLFWFFVAGCGGVSVELELELDWSLSIELGYLGTVLDRAEERRRRRRMG